MTDAESENQGRLPVAAIMADMFGTILIALGIVGLSVGSAANFLPFVLDPDASWSLIAVGGALIAFAFPKVLKFAR